MPELASTHVAIIGLGYVGLPLAVEFSKILLTTGFDLYQIRIAELQDGQDVTLEVTGAELSAAKQLRFTSSLDDLKECNVFIIAVPTPIDANKRPDLRPLEGASRTVGQALSPGAVVI